MTPPPGKADNCKVWSTKAAAEATLEMSKRLGLNVHWHTGKLHTQKLARLPPGRGHSKEPDDAREKDVMG